MHETRRARDGNQVELDDGDEDGKHLEMVLACLLNIHWLRDERSSLYENEYFSWRLSASTDPYPTEHPTNLLVSHQDRSIRSLTHSRVHPLDVNHTLFQSANENPKKVQRFINWTNCFARYSVSSLMTSALVRGSTYMYMRLSALPQWLFIK